MDISEIHTRLLADGHKVRCVRLKDGALDVVTRRRTMEVRAAETKLERIRRDAREEAEHSAALAAARELDAEPGPMTYLEALGRAAMGERTAEVRNTIARGVARLAKERA